MKATGRWYFAFGLFLIICGYAGYASNPEEAQTALYSGSMFGSLCAMIGIGIYLKFWFMRHVAFVVTLLLITAFCWRATVGWLAVSAGEPKLFAASLITAMLVASVLSFLYLLKNWKKA